MGEANAMQHLTFIKTILLLGSLALSSCAVRGHEDYPALVERDRTQRQSWSQLDGGEQTAVLGDLIQSEQVGPLIKEALDANPGLRQTLLTLSIRQAEYRQTSGKSLPAIDAEISTSRQQDTDTVYTGSVSVSWEVDLWGKVANSIQAAQKDMAQQEALYQAARDTLAAEVMKTWLSLIAAQKNITIEGKRLAVLENNEAFILQRYKSGLGNLEDLDSARGETSTSRASVAQYRETLAQNQRIIQKLLGRADNFRLNIPEEYAAVILPLADLPEQTLRRRPDLKAAYLAIEAASLRTRIAYKDLLPSINLQAALSDVASSPASALMNNPVWSLLGQLSAPLFQGGQLMTQTKIAELKTAQSYQAYRETLLEAVQDVEDAIGLERSLTERAIHIESALTRAQNNLHHYELSYRAGLVNILDLLNVQEQNFDLEIQLNNLIHEFLASRIDLGLALGLGVQ
jgi:NodT family efflux transporter outer membrane factor (OMF) lipoprotein